MQWSYSYVGVIVTVNLLSGERMGEFIYTVKYVDTHLGRQVARMLNRAVRSLE